ncbi:hypothetical protein BDY21DRAFT_330338 [Lineolata rhizophorae]|uniref:Fe2OG dioxygenase domain-containing protein n=1 Tax=Lineolata rhizophorae TaxID=578093 RepID=A0A6A6PDJ1_9PEZI|nr:hypothetical protein BDY21DRAFT_330338 [Lineolata rhizophorae]
MSRAVASAVEKDELFIPLIDFSLFLHGTPSEKQSTATAILDGFKRAGFIYIKKHGISPETVSTVFSQSASFFARPQAQKDALAWTTPESNRGYVAHGREKVTQLESRGDVDALRQAIPDLKESMEIGRESDAKYPNNWPDGFDDEGKTFKETMLGFFDECKDLHMQIMRAIALGLGIDEKWFDGYTDVGDNNLRLLHYPSVEKSVFKAKKGQVRAGEHSDYGSITLLFQDDRGGLQVESPLGTFVDATPIPDTIVINAGDLLARWSNDTIKSTKHRVVEPPLKPDQEQSDVYPARYSVAYFCNPNFDKYIEAIPGTFGETAEKKYPGINSGEYLVQRLAATY